MQNVTDADPRPPTPDTEPRPPRWWHRRAKATDPEQPSPPPAEPDDQATEPPARRVNAWATARKPRAASPPRAALGRSRWAVLGVAVLGLLVLAIVAVGLNTALGPLRDTATAAHIDPAAARLYWIGVDGLIVVAIIAAMILRHEPAARRYALGIVALFTLASGLLQFLHGLGWTTPDRVTGVVPPLPWGVVVVVAMLVIGTIFCGTHLFVYVLRQLFPNAMADQGEGSAASAGDAAAKAPESGSGDSDTDDGPGDNDRPKEPPLDPETDREVRKWFAAIAVHLVLDAGGKPVRSKIARSFEIADRQAGYVIADVTADREETAERQAREAEAAKAAQANPAPTAPPVGSVNGSGPTGTAVTP